MKKLLKWFGIFLGTVIVLLVVVILLLDTIVKWGIETGGTRVVGARVELAAADLSFFPLGLELDRLQVTNPDEPMKNALEIERTNLSFDTWKLIKKKVYINEMAADNVRFNTQRQISGAVVNVKKIEKKPLSEITAGKLPSFQIADVKAILAREKLYSVDKIKKLKMDLDREKQNYQKQLWLLPDKKAFDEYEERIKKANKSGKGIGRFINIAGEAAEIYKAIKKDIDKLDQTQHELRRSINTFNGRIQEISQAPSSDFRRIKAKYTISPRGLGNMTNLIFGPKYAGWVETGLTWYNKLVFSVDDNQGRAEKSTSKPDKPAATNESGSKKDSTTPDFLIQTAHVSLKIDAGDIDGVIKDITDNQSALGRPLTFNFSAENLERLKSVKMKGLVNHVFPEKTVDTMAVEISGYAVEQVSISANPELPVILEKAQADMDVRAAVHGNDIDLNIAIAITSARFSSGTDKDAGAVSMAVSTALSEVSEFSVSADIKGSLDNYDIKISSDLDKVMQKALSKIVKQQTAEFDKKLKKEIESITAGKIDDLKDHMGAFNSFDKELTDRLKIGDDLLKSIKKI